MGMYMDHNIRFNHPLLSNAELADRICKIIEQEPDEFPYLYGKDFHLYDSMVYTYFETSSFNAHDDISDELRLLSLRLGDVTIYYHLNTDSEGSSARSVFHGDQYEEAWAEITYDFTRMRWED